MNTQVHDVSIEDAAHKIVDWYQNEEHDHIKHLMYCDGVAMYIRQNHPAITGILASIDHDISNYDFVREYLETNLGEDDKLAELTQDMILREEYMELVLGIIFAEIQHRWEWLMGDGE